MKNKHTHKKIAIDMYQYRGWIIKKYDNNYLLDPEIRGFQWNTYRNEERFNSSECTDIAKTLRDAKIYIDICMQREVK